MEFDIIYDEMNKMDRELPTGFKRKQKISIKFETGTKSDRPSGGL